MALSVDGIRTEMLRGIRVPRKMVNAAIQKTYEQLEAQETKFFTYKGDVVSQKDVSAHDIQAAATDRIFSLAGLYAKEREATSHTPTVAVEVDPVSGVIRLVVGSQGALPPSPKALVP